MANTELLIKLRELHEELGVINDDLKAVEAIDEQTIDALGELVSDVSHLVDRAKTSAELQDEESDPSDLLNRISEFQSSHPKVTRFLSQLTDMLAMLGI